MTGAVYLFIPASQYMTGTVCFYLLLTHNVPAVIHSIVAASI
jgi:hypothetical protein